MKRFSDFSEEEKPIEGTKLKLDGTRHIVFTGSDVLIKQMRKYEKELPFTATIVKVDKYYTLK